MQIEIEGKVYRAAAKLNAFQQFHVVRRVLPVLSSVFEGDDAGFMRRAIGAMAGMPDADCDFVLRTCLAVVQRQQGQAWAPVIAPQQGLAMMFDDIGLTELMQLTVEVIKENLSGFFSAAAALGMELPATQAATG